MSDLYAPTTNRRIGSAIRRRGTTTNNYKRSATEPEDRTRRQNQKTEPKPEPEAEQKQNHQLAHVISKPQAGGLRPGRAMSITNKN